MSNELSHFNSDGQAIMVDVGNKPTTNRVAVASGQVTMRPETLQQITTQDNKKGNVFAVARIAGIMAAKQTATLIPLCHQLPLSSVTIDFTCNQELGIITITAAAKSTGVTGVEMEALTAVSITALTIYDMCKAVEKEMVIGGISLLRKTGGKNGTFIRNQ